MAYDQITADVIAENNLLRYEIAILKGERDRLKLWQEDVENREAAVCPEDVGFDEYIRALNTKVEQLIEQLHAATEDYANARSKTLEEAAELADADRGEVPRSAIDPHGLVPVERRWDSGASERASLRIAASIRALAAPEKP